MAENNTKIKKSNTIVHPRYGCSIGAAYTVSAIPRAVPMVNCGPGCMDKQYFMMSFGNGFQGTATGPMPSVNLGENEVVFGGAQKLDALIKSSLKIMDGDLYVVLTGCAAALIGDDVGSIVKKYREKGKAVVFAETAGFKGNNLIGHEIVVQAVIDQFVGEYKGKKRKGLINLWTEAPYFNTNWRGDYIELKRILEGAGFQVNVLFGPESRGVEDWKQIPRAQFNLLVSPWVGIEIAEYLEKKYKQPFLHFPIIPIGEEATAEFIRRTVAFAGIDPQKSEKFIEKESHQYYYFLEHFSEFIAEYWYGLPSKFAVVGDSAYNIALTKFLADQMGMIPVKQIITDNPPARFRPTISELYRELSSGVSAEAQFIEDGYLIEKELKNAAFGSSVPLILGTSWESDVARELKGLLLEVSPPVTEEVVLNRSYVGYKGALTLLEKIYTAAVSGE